MLRDRKKLLDSLRAFKAGEIVSVLGEGDDHFIRSIERRLEALNAQLAQGQESGERKNGKGGPRRGRPSYTTRS